MFRFVLFLCCAALCQSHAILPLVAPVAHSIHVPLVAPYAHGYGHGLWGHGFLAKPLGHHILKRSPHIVEPLAHGHLGHVGHVAPLAYVAPVAHAAPVAVSHHSRLDVHTTPVVKQVIAPVVAAPLLHKPVLGAHGLGLGAYAGGLSHYAGGLGHYAGEFGHYAGGFGHYGGLGHHAGGFGHGYHGHY